MPDRDRMEKFKDMESRWSPAIFRWAAFYICVLNYFVLLQGLILAGNLAAAIAFFLTSIIGFGVNFCIRDLKKETIEKFEFSRNGMIRSNEAKSL
jgi:hypothetical protein